jgi:hypothetical protein
MSNLILGKFALENLYYSTLPESKLFRMLRKSLSPIASKSKVKAWWGQVFAGYRCRKSCHRAEGFDQVQGGSSILTLILAMGARG